MKAKTWVWIAAAASFLAALSLFIFDGTAAVLTATALGYTGVLSAWLGYDILKTRDRTLSAPAGKYEDIHIGRYLFSLLTVAALLVVTIVKDDGTLGGVKVTLVPCVFGMVAAMITVYGANKVATPKGRHEVIPSTPPGGRK